MNPINTSSNVAYFNNISFKTTSYTTKMLMCQQTADMLVTALIDHDQDRTLGLWGTVPLELKQSVLSAMVEIMDTVGIIYTTGGYTHA